MSLPKEIRVCSLFCGIGGFELGLTQASPRFKIVFSNEIDKYACQIYRKNFREGELYEGDITKVNTNDIPDHDLLTAGFPCQAFSIAGKRRGFDDTRGTMFFEIARICRAKKPRLILLENVKGLLSHDSGRTFQTILKVLSDIGYVLQWQVLNSKNFGVPQNRERVFIIGHLRGTSRPQVFPIGGANEKNTAELQEITKNVSDAQRVYDDRGIAKSLKGLGGGLGAKTGLYATLTPNRLNKRQNGRRFKNNEEPMFTLTGQDIHGITIIDKKGNFKNKNYASTLTGGAHSGGNHSDMDLLKNNMKIRRLTPIECERLQGFPDKWTQKGIDINGNEINISDTQRYKCLGNAVTTNVITEIGKRLIK